MTNPVLPSHQPVFHTSHEPQQTMNPGYNTERESDSPPETRLSKDEDLIVSRERLTPPYPVTPNNPAAEEQRFGDLETVTTNAQQREILLDVETLIERVRQSKTPDETIQASSPDSDPTSIAETEQGPTSENTATPATTDTEDSMTKEEALTLALTFKEEYAVYLAKHNGFLARGTALSVDEQREMEGWVGRLKEMKRCIKRGWEEKVLS